MINVDLSKVLHPRLYDYLAAFLPGLFFEISVLMANPELASGLTSRFHSGFSTNSYLLLGVALFLAFVIGNGFILVDAFIQYLLVRLNQLGRFLWKKLCEWPLSILSSWALKHPKWKRPWLFRLHQLFISAGFPGSPELRRVQGCWRVLARALVQTRYGINPEDFGVGEFDVLYWILGAWTPEERRGSIFIVALHATGWAGLVATRFAPLLRNRFYVVFCSFLILSGLMHAFYVAKRNFDLLVGGYINLRAVLRLFPKPSTANVPKKDA